ncbi:MAG: LiaF transmembrane domain-containing protein [Acidobacteriota bacterium]
MKCYYHPQVDSVQTCAVCRRYLCQACAHTVKGNIYCQDCLVSGAELAGIVNTPSFATFSPSRAALLALIPGMGAVYNRQYTTAVTHFAIFIGLWVLAAEASGVFAIAVFAFYIFTIMDAYRAAQAIIRRRVAHPEIAEGAENFEQINAPIWGGILILLGIFFFLDNIGLISFRFMVQFWPLLLVALGIYLIVDHYKRPNGGARTEPRASTGYPASGPPRPPHSLEQRPSGEENP